MFIYIHIPFCRSHCIYCDFYVVLEKYGGKEAYVKALCQEIHGRLSKQTSLTPIETLYIGGGTPSLLEVSAYQEIFDTLNSYTTFSPQAEITIEMNPGRSASEPHTYLDIGFNRVSVGVQSFNDNELKKLSRNHSSEDAEQWINQLKHMGWKNISLDLMYAIPQQTMDSWKKTLERTVALDIQHVSMYGLQIEEGTPLNHLVTTEAPGYNVPGDKLNSDMYQYGIRFLESNGFRRYEFSNLAQNGYASQHNLNYWNNGEYYAFGAGAHGYIENKRYKNSRNWQQYLDNPLKSETSKPCSPQEQLENAVILGLRKTEGIHIKAIELQFGISFHQRFGWILEKYLADEFLDLKNNTLKLTDKAVPVSHFILSDFIDS